MRRLTGQSALKADDSDSRRCWRLGYVRATRIDTLVSFAVLIIGDVSESGTSVVVWLSWFADPAMKRHYAVARRASCSATSASCEAGQCAPAAPPANAPNHKRHRPARDQPPGQPVSAARYSSTTAAAHASRNYWTNFRGPNRDGRYDEMSVLTELAGAGTATCSGKQPVGVGYASFTIADGRAYTIEQRRRQEVVAAYDVNTGRELWTQAWNAEFTATTTGDGPRTTPTWDDGRLYALGATGELRCLDAKTRRSDLGKEYSDRQSGCRTCSGPWPRRR